MFFQNQRENSARLTIQLIESQIPTGNKTSLIINILVIPIRLGGIYRSDWSRLSLGGLRKLI